MKKLQIIAYLLLCTTLAKAQITLDHFYATTSGISLVHVEGDGDKYLGTDTTSKNLVLFNTDHSLWKTLPTAMPGFYVGYIGYISKTLFNSDSKIEILISVNSVTGASHGYKLINEDGTLIMDFPNALSGAVVQVGGTWKLIVSYVDFVANISQSAVYNLPGTYAGIAAVNDGSATSSKLFPNPVATAATLQYHLPASVHTAQLSIYNAAGDAVKQLTVSDMFNDIIISRDELPAGSYIYRITTATGTLATAQFQVR